MPTKDLNELSQPHHRKLLLCEEISDPGNLGTLVRSALAFGFDAVLLIGHTAEPYAPKVARASAGAIFGLRVCEISLMDLDDLVGRHHMVVIASDLSGAAELETVRKTIKRRKILLAVGSEATGLSKAVLDRADVRVRIRHSEKVESLNAAVAGSILMKEVHDIIH
jgi:TrmH family RNA methyltransferase